MFSVLSTVIYILSFYNNPEKLKGNYPHLQRFGSERPNDFLYSLWRWYSKNLNTTLLFPK